MTEEEALAALAEARANKKGWLRIAELLEVVRDSDIGGSPGKLSVAFMEAAARVTRYAPIFLRRMSRARTFLFDFDREHPSLRLLEQLDGGTGQFSKVELLARLYKMAPAKALEIVGPLAEGSLRMKDLDLIYREAIGAPMPANFSADPFGGVPAFPAPRPPLGKPRRRFLNPFHQACWDALQKDVAKLSGEGDVRLSCEFKFTYFNPFAIAVGMKGFGIDFVDGFYPAELPAEPSRAELNRVLRDVAFQAPFFRRFWVLAPLGESKDKIGAELTAINLEAIGCAELRQKGLSIYKRSSGMMAAQNQALLASNLLEAGIPKGLSVRMPLTSLNS